MPTKKSSPDREPRRKLPPATSPEAREQQLVAYAYDLVEERILAGTASAQETTHFLKAGQARNQLELEKLRLENKLLEVRTQQIGDQEQYMRLQEEAMQVFGGYSGKEISIGDDEDDD